LSERGDVNETQTKVKGLSPESLLANSVPDWPSSHCIPAQKFMSVSSELNYNRWSWVLNSSKDVFQW